MKYIVESEKPCEVALQDLEAAVVAHGFGVLHAYNLQATLQSKGFEMPHACHILEICNPRQASDVLTEDMSMNIALPCRVSVYEDNGTKIATVLPTKLLGALSESSRLMEIAEEVEEKIRDMIADAV